MFDVFKEIFKGIFVGNNHKFSRMIPVTKRPTINPAPSVRPSPPPKPPDSATTQILKQIALQNMILIVFNSDLSNPKIDYTPLLWEMLKDLKEEALVFTKEINNYKMTISVSMEKTNG
jgi:hypothetical protein